MAGGQIEVVLRHIRRLAAAGQADKLSDRELLDCFAKHRDELAFPVLVRRHGPLVLATCRRLLVDPNDVETLQDLVLAAYSDALKKSRELAAQKLGGVTGGLKIPGM